MSEIQPTSTSPSHSVSSTASSPTSFHSNQELDQESIGNDLKEVELDQEEAIDSREQATESESARTTLGEELDQDKLGQIHNINLDDDGQQIGETGDKQVLGEGESTSSNQQTETDGTKDELLKQQLSSLPPTELTSAQDPESEESIAVQQDAAPEAEEAEEAPATPSTPNPNLGQAATPTLISTPTSTSTTNSPGDSKRSSPIKTKSTNGGKGGVAELMKRFQSKDDKNSPTASPARSANGAESAKKDLPTKSLIKEMGSVSVSNEKQTESSTVSKVESDSQQASTSNSTSQPSESPTTNSYSNQFSPSTSSHNRQESESLLNSTIPWAFEISNSSSSKTVQDVVQSDEPNRFSDAISSNNFKGSSLIGFEAEEDSRKKQNSGNGERSSSTRFSTVSLSSNKISEDEPLTDTSIGNKRNTITKNSRNSNSNYEFLLARLENENGRLSRDPKANRSSIDGNEKLKNDFIKLKKEKESNRSSSGGLHSRENSKEVATGGSHSRKTSNLKEDISKDESSSSESNVEQSPTSENEDDQIDWDFWGSVMNNYQLIAQTKPLELSLAIQAGIPPALRGMMWQLMSSSKDEEMEIIYAYYLKQTSSHEKSIRRDLSRTFPEQDYFKDGKGVGQENLFNVIKAYSLYDEEVGYCQGMQFIVGPLLLNMPDEEAFSTLVRLMKSYDLRGHFTPNMPSLQLRLFQFDCLIEELLPLLHKHLVRCGIKSSMYASQWFMTCEFSSQRFL